MESRRLIQAWGGTKGIGSLEKQKLRIIGWALRVRDGARNPEVDMICLTSVAGFYE